MLPALQGVCAPTQRDGDAAYYADMLRASAPAPRAPPAGGSRAAAAAAALGADTAEALERAGLRVWAGGLGHTEYRAAAATAASGSPGALLADELE